MKNLKNNTKYWVGKDVVSRHNGIKVRVWEIIDDKNFSGVVVEIPYPYEDDVVKKYIGYEADNWNISAFELADYEVFKVLMEEAINESNM